MHIKSIAYAFLVMIVGCTEIEESNLLLANKGVNAAAITKEGRYAIVASTNHDLAVWDLSTKKYLHTWRHKKGQQANTLYISISNNSKYALTAEKQHLVLWNIATGTSIASLTPPAPVKAIALGPTGRYALVALLNRQTLLIDLIKNQAIQALEHSELVNSVAISPNGKFALTASDDHYAVLWDLNKVKPIHKWKHNKRVKRVMFSNDNQWAVSFTSLGKVQLWGITNGQLIQTIAQSKISVTSARFSNDNKQLVLGTLPRNLQLWQLSNNKRIAQWLIPKDNFWKPGSAFIYGLAFSKNTLITIDSSGYARWWALK